LHGTDRNQVPTSPISALVNDPDRISKRICCKGGEQRVSRFAVRDSVFPNG
jgi:hypothetical protein